MRCPLEEILLMRGEWQRAGVGREDRLSRGCCSRPCWRWVRTIPGWQRGCSRVKAVRDRPQLHPSSDPPRAGGRLRFRAPRPPALLGHCSFRVPLGTEALPQSTAQQVAPASSQLGHTLLPLSGNILRSSAQSGCKHSLHTPPATAGDVGSAGEPT